MNNFLVCAIGLSLVMPAAAISPSKKPPMTPEQRAKLVEVRCRQTGGFLQVKGEGFLGILNAQSSVAEAEIVSCVDLLRKCARDVDVKVLPATFSISTAQAERTKADAGAAVFIIDDVSLPVSLIAMEEGWGFVNVARLRGNGVSAEKFAMRFRKEFVRVTSVVFTGPKSQYKTSPLQVVRSVGDLDKIVGESYGIDFTMGLMNGLADFGVKPGRMVTYRVACQEGWAAAPTNEYQKAIWDKVHAIPQNPMKIEYDPKRGR